MYNGSEFTNTLILNPIFLFGLTILSAYLLNAPLRLFALKFDNYSFKDNSIKYIFLILSLVLVLTLQFLAIPLIVIAYVLFSLMDSKTSDTLETD